MTCCLQCTVGFGVGRLWGDLGGSNQRGGKVGLSGWEVFTDDVGWPVVWVTIDCRRKRERKGERGIIE